MIIPVYLFPFVISFYHIHVQRTTLDLDSWTGHRGGVQAIHSCDNHNTIALQSVWLQHAMRVANHTHCVLAVDWVVPTRGARRRGQPRGRNGAAPPSPSIHWPPTASFIGLRADLLVNVQPVHLAKVFYQAGEIRSPLLHKHVYPQIISVIRSLSSLARVIDSLS